MIYLLLFDREAGAESAHDMARGGDEAKSGKIKCFYPLATYINMTYLFTIQLLHARD